MMDDDLSWFQSTVKPSKAQPRLLRPQPLKPLPRAHAF
jgi:hypothetical protein